MQQFFRKLNIGFADLYVTGFCVGIGAAEISHLAGLFLNWELGRVSVLWAVLFIALLFICMALWRRFRRKEDRMPACHKALPIAFVLLLLVQMIYIYCMQQVTTPGDITLATVTTFLHENGIHKVNPLTGGEYVNPLAMGYKILCLPTLYASVCRLTGLVPEVFVYHMMPLFVLGGCYFAYYQLSEMLFPQSMGKRYTFMILLVLLFWMLDRDVYLDGYGMMQAGYLGTSIRSLILIPWTLVKGMKKQWWYCILCVLAEACICQTRFGLGLCVLVLLGTVILHWWEEKVMPTWEKRNSKEAVS